MALDLADWKQIELSAHTELQNAEKQICIANLLLRESRRMIKGLGGKTWEDDEKDRKSRTATDSSVY